MCVCVEDRFLFLTCKASHLELDRNTQQINKPSHFKRKLSDVDVWFFFHHHCSHLSWKAAFDVSSIIDSPSIHRSCLNTAELLPCAMESGRLLKGWRRAILPRLYSFFSSGCFDLFFAPGVGFLDPPLPLFAVPPPSAPPGMNDSLREQALSLPKSVEHCEKAMQQSQSSTLISPCCVTLQKPNVPNSYLVFFFPTVTLGIDCLCFLMFAERAWGLQWGEPFFLTHLTPP